MKKEGDIMTTINIIPNRLAKEKSPYLLQPAYNHLNWYPWGNEAFEKAKSEDKPIFLYIGYSQLCNKSTCIGGKRVCIIKEKAYIELSC